MQAHPALFTASQVESEGRKGYYSSQTPADAKPHPRAFFQKLIEQAFSIDNMEQGVRVWCPLSQLFLNTRLIMTG